jgi:hypothetical protein
VKQKYFTDSNELQFTRPDTRSTEKLRGVKFSKVYMDVYMEIYTSKYTRSTRDALRHHAMQATTNKKGSICRVWVRAHARACFVQYSCRNNPTCRSCCYFPVNKKPDDPRSSHTVMHAYMPYCLTSKEDLIHWKHVQDNLSYLAS